MKKYKIFAGLGGGFGGASYIGTYEFNSQEKADDYAYQEAIEIYESMEGLHGLESLEDVEGELGADYSEEEIYYEYEQRRESWLDYSAEEVI